VRIIGRWDVHTERLVRGELLRWDVAPENMPYALHAGFQPEMIPTGEVIACRIDSRSTRVERGDRARAIRRGRKWVIASVSQPSQPVE